MDSNVQGIAIIGEITRSLEVGRGFNMDDITGAAGITYLMGKASGGNIGILFGRFSGPDVNTGV